MLGFNGEPLGFTHYVALGLLLGAKLAHHHCLPMIARTGQATTPAVLVLVASSSLALMCGHAVRDRTGFLPSHPPPPPCGRPSLAHVTPAWLASLLRRGRDGCWLTYYLVSRKWYSTTPRARLRSLVLSMLIAILVANSTAASPENNWLFLR